MHRLVALTAALLALLLVLGASGSARAQACNPIYLPDFCQIEPTAAQGQDVSPYCFQPNTVRGQSETNYAVNGFDEDGACHHFLTYLKFDLPANLLTAGKTVTYASILVPFAFTFVFGEEPPAPPFPPSTLRVHRVLSSWTENTVTWANKPIYDGIPIFTLNGITNFGTRELVVTDQVRRWAHGQQPNFGFVLSSPTETALGFQSWEAAVPASAKPALYIETGNGTPPPPIPALPGAWSALLVLGVATLLARPWLH